VNLYSRPQLRVLLALATLGGLGLVAGEWRRAHPHLAARVERFDLAHVGATEPALGSRPGRVSTARGAPAAPLDLNRATLGDLDRLPGIGPGLARRILDERDRRGRFGSVDDLASVRGIRTATLDRLRDLVTVGE
jgi:competence protein ComEA